MSDPVTELARLYGILPGYRDLSGQDIETGRGTQIALLAAMGVDVASDRDAEDRLRQETERRASRRLPGWFIVDCDSPARIETAGTWTITLETGVEIEGRGRDLPPLPLGIHSLSASGERATVISAPPTLPMPAKGWGVTGPLWGLGGPDRPGIGDFDDLAREGVALAGHGAAFLGLNPVHLGFPVDPTAVSPYSPSHRRRLNPLHIATPGGECAGPLVDYAREIPAKRLALRRAYGDFCTAGPDDGFETYLRDEGEALRRFTLHQALSERHGPFWTDWPAGFHDPDAISDGDLGEDMRFHAWLQWTAERQLGAANEACRAAGMRFGLYLDLAVGTHPGGAETWTDRHWFASGVSLGAPGDSFAPDGQVWNLAPFDPQVLVAGDFRILAETIRKQLAFSRLLRIDHILGFERAFWAPQDRGVPGGYVRMPREAMLAVVRVEAARADATIVGEDLGNIPAGLQDALIASGILGCRVMQFEDFGGEPFNYPARSLASFGTHDLPTWAGWTDAADIAAWADLGRIDAATASDLKDKRHESVARFVASCGGASVDDMHTCLANTASALVAVQLEDAFGVRDQTNLPGTIHDHPNWRRRLPVAPAGESGASRLGTVAAIMRASGRT